MKKNLLISFSGGETSAYLTQWCLNYLKDVYNMVVVFANTGDEREETLEFVKKCDDILDFNTFWIEPVVYHGERKGTGSKMVDFKTASRNGGPFEEVIKKYGIPNQAYPHCTRELKTQPITHFVKNTIGWDDYSTAIGIRVDEFDRMDKNAEEKKYIYPLVDPHPMTKPEINKYWENMTFRLELKGYEGNCKACWKKSYRKLMTIAKETPESFDVFKRLEKKYENHAPRDRSIEKAPFRFFRGNKSVEEVLQMAEKPFKPAIDDSTQTEYQLRIFDELDRGFGCEESCEPF